MEKSTHKVEVVRLGPLEKHPNADKLEIAKIFGYTVCCQIGNFKEGMLAAYIPPDSVVPNTPEFSFLNGHFRIKVKKLRGIVSQGFLIPAPEGAKEGDNVAEIVGVTHYDPPEPMSTGGDAEKAPPGYRPAYDVDSFFRYGHLFKPGETVVVTEKIHGASARYGWHDGRLYCGSRTEWKKEDSTNLWWKAANNTPELAKFCEANPDLTVYGEVFGQVQDLKYGAKPGEVFFRAFDLMRGNQWVSWAESMELTRHNECGTVGGPGYEGVMPTLPWVPIIYIGEYDESYIRSLADGESQIKGAKNIREGVVVKPMIERTDPAIGRVQLKIVSDVYLERA